MNWGTLSRYDPRRLREHGELRRVADALLAAILGPQCVGCSRVLEHPTRGPVCPTCWSEVATLSTLTNHRGLSPIDAYRAAGAYEGTLRSIVRAFKYDGRRTLAVPLGRLALTAGQDVLDAASCVVPVPLHPWRRFRRGFDQAADLATALDLPVLHALRRTRATRPQTGLTASGRRRNVRGAFSDSPGLTPLLRRELLIDQAVVLVDDVRTTGATLRACAHVLKRAGAREVRALTIAWARPTLSEGRDRR
jgi:ComF family protein